MKALFPILALASLSSAAFGQQLFSASTFGTSDGGFIQRTADAVAGPLAYSDSQTLTFGDSTFQGVTRTHADYGKIGVYSRSDLDDRHDAPLYTYTRAGGGFLDPLTISGGTAGGSIHAEIRLRGTPEIEFTTYYGYYTNVEFYVLDGDSWVSADDQSFGGRDDGVDGSSIDYTATVTLANYDPARTYALTGTAVVTSEVDRANLPGASHALVDAEHTAQITQIGFVGANGLSGGFVGASGHVYAPVPEPASLLVLGIGGLTVLVRRKR